MNTINKFIILGGKIKVGKTSGTYNIVVRIQRVGAVYRVPLTPESSLFSQQSFVGLPSAKGGSSKGLGGGLLCGVNLNIQVWGTLRKRCQWLACGVIFLVRDSTRWSN